MRNARRILCQVRSDAGIATNDWNRDVASGALKNKLNNGLPLMGLEGVTSLCDDANSDGGVDSQDFNVLAGHFGELGSLPVSSGNFNGDNMVDSLNRNALISQYGTPPSGVPIGGAVPETISAGLLALVGMGMRRKRDR